MSRRRLSYQSQRRALDRIKRQSQDTGQRSKRKQFNGLGKRGPAQHRRTYCRWEWQDPQRPEYWTACTVSVFDPSYERPYISILASIANGGGKCLMRTATLADMRLRLVIPAQYITRLELAITQATGVLTGLQRDLRVITEVGHLADGDQLVNTGTGEVVAEAERIAYGRQS